MISVCFQGKPYNITVIQVYAPTTDAEEAEVDWFSEDLQHLLELTPKNYVLFIIGDWNARLGSQEIPGSREMSNRVLPREHTGHSKNPFSTIQEPTLHRDITRRSVPKSTNYILCSEDGEDIYSEPKQDLELTVTQIISFLL